MEINLANRILQRIMKFIDEIKSKSSAVQIKEGFLRVESRQLHRLYHLPAKTKELSFKVIY